MKKTKDLGVKVLWTCIMLLITVTLDIFLLLNLGEPVLPEHKRELFTQMFTGTFGDWVGFAVFNVLTAFLVFGVWGAYEHTEEENSTKWGPIWAVCLVISLLLIAAI